MVAKKKYVSKKKSSISRSKPKSKSFSRKTSSASSSRSKPKKRSSSKKTSFKKNSKNSSSSSSSSSSTSIFSSLSSFFSSKRVKSIGIILLSLILLFGIIYFLGIQSKFLADDELYIAIDPLAYSLSVNNSDSAVVNFSVSVDKPSVCETTCNFTLVDQSSGSIVSSQSRVDFNDGSFSFPLEVPSTGEGQSLFNFKVVCYNQRNSLCTSQEKKFYKNALITLNYNLSEENILLKSQAKNQLDSFLSDLNVMNTLLSESNFYITSLEYSPTLSNVSSPVLFSEEVMLSDNLISLNNSFQSLLVTKNELISEWSVFDFNSVISTINSVSSERTNALSSLTSLRDSSRGIYSQLNSSFNSIQTFYSYEPSFYSAKKFFTMINDSAHLNLLANLENDINEFIIFTSQKNYSSIQQMYDRSVDLLNQSNSLLTDYHSQENALANSLISDKKLLFDIRNYLSSGSFPLLGISSSSLQQRISFNSACIDLGNELVNVTSSNILAQQEKESLYPFMNNSVLLHSASEEFIDFIINKRTSPTLSFSLNASIYDNAPSDYPYTNDSGTFTTFNITSISENTFRQISPINVSRIINNSYSRYCLWSLPVSPIQFTNVTLPFLPLVSNYSYISLINTSLPLLIPLCPYEGNASFCCQGNDCDMKYPIILVHGHSFNKDNSPELAFTRLSLLQNSLEDLGYVNAGQISPNSGFSSIPDGDWGKSKQPISVLVSYYYITHKDMSGLEFTTRKTDGIENYAIRLKDMIDVVKQRTGKDKVIIIAHSMGGLVAREYISLFGGEDVVKLITLGTPNLGIEGDVKTLCPVTGGKKECEDMNFNSVFMSRLNSPSSTPQFTDVYTVTAHGCQMKDEAGNKEDGDGVVLARNVPLPFATNYDINGTCTDFLQSNLHLKFVEPDLYPETFNIIKQILAS